MSAHDINRNKRDPTLEFSRSCSTQSQFNDPRPHSARPHSTKIRGPSNLPRAEANNRKFPLEISSARQSNQSFSKHQEIQEFTPLQIDTNQRHFPRQPSNPRPPNSHQFQNEIGFSLSRQQTPSFTHPSRDIDTAVLAWDVPEVCNWLVSLGQDVALYAKNFQENELTGEDIIGLTKEDLRLLGIRKLGHQNKILREAHKLCGDTQEDGTTDSSCGRTAELEMEVDELRATIRNKDEKIEKLKSEFQNVLLLLQQITTKIKTEII